jgi:hypothetical protein
VVGAAILVLVLLAAATVTVVIKLTQYFWTIFTG